MNPLDILLTLVTWIGVILAAGILLLLLYIAIALPIGLIRNKSRSRPTKVTTIRRDHFSRR